MPEKSYPCPCCGYLTMLEETRGSFDYCPICFWEDDDVQFSKPDRRGGANRVSLNEARENFKNIGASRPDRVPRVRPPKPEEIP